MIRTSKEIVRMTRPLIKYDMEKVLNILNTGLNLLVPEESDEQVSKLLAITAQKLISDATLEIANRN
jgi:hypothetical protein